MKVANLLSATTYQSSNKNFKTSNVVGTLNIFFLTVNFSQMYYWKNVNKRKSMVIT